MQEYPRYYTPYDWIMDDFGYSTLSHVIVNGDIHFPYFPQ